MKKQIGEWNRKTHMRKGIVELDIRSEDEQWQSTYKYENQMDAEWNFYDNLCSCIVNP